MTVLVTGGAGCIGSHMTYALADAGERVVVLDNLSTGVRANVAGDAVFVQGEVGDAALVKRLIAEHGIDAVIALDDGPPVNFCKPAVDPLFTSAIDVWHGGILALVLTGMGSDGMRGGTEIAAAGGSVIAQDEATSVVWGMPGAAANAGICAAVLPLNQIAPKLNRLLSGDRS